jgi:uncharacterized membrane protein
VTRKPIEKQESLPAKPHKEQKTIEGEVEEKLGPVLESLSRVQRTQILSKVTAIVRTEVFSGPLPHPRHLDLYNSIVPNGGERIFKMTEDALNSNITRAERGQRYDNTYRMTGMIMGFVALMTLVLLAFVSGWYDHLALAGMLLGGSVLGSIGMFINGRRTKDS